MRAAVSKAANSNGSLRSEAERKRGRPERSQLHNRGKLNAKARRDNVHAVQPTQRRARTIQTQALQRNGHTFTRMTLVDDSTHKAPRYGPDVLARRLLRAIDRH